MEKRGEIWYFTKRINGQRYRESTGFADKKSAERRAVEIEHDIRAGIHGWKSTIPSFAEWWAVYRKTYTPLKSARNRDAQIVAHFLPHSARRLDEITKSDIVRHLNVRRTAEDRQSRTQEPTSCVREHRSTRARPAAVHLRAGHRRGSRLPQPVPGHQAREGQAPNSRA